MEMGMGNGDGDGDGRKALGIIGEWRLGRDWVGNGEGADGDGDGNIVGGAVGARFSITVFINRHARLCAP